MLRKASREAWFRANVAKDNAPVDSSETMLVVVDTCADSSASVSIIEPVLTQIDLAKAQGWGIMFLQTRGLNPTYPELIARTSGYDRVAACVFKDGNDGSTEIVLSALNREFSIHRIRFCGNWASVYDTVGGLLDLVPYAAVEVVRDACNSPASNGSWQQFNHGNIQLL